MSEDPGHGATKIHASKGGGGGSKWLLGAAVAVVLAGGGFLAWKTLAADPDNPQTAYNDTYNADPLRTGAIDQDQETNAESASTDDSIAEPAAVEPRSTTPARRAATARAPVVPEDTIGITPVSTTQDSDEIVVTGVRRPIWVRTPSERRLSSLYPARALERGREGEARLHCTVQSDGALNCARVSETPGFGNAALRVARTLRHAPQLADGTDASGTPVNLRVVFRLPEEERRG